MRLCVFLLLLILRAPLNGQFGLRAFIIQNEFDDWEQTMNSASFATGADLFNINYDVSFDYWIRLKNHRIEFYPALGYGRFHTRNPGPSGFIEYDMHQWSLGLNAHAYFLDLSGDCDCPTFSKQGGWMKKGLFLLVKPSYNLFYKSLMSETIQNEHRSQAIELSGGLGLDIGINNLLTITPILRFSYFPSITWDGFTPAHGIVNVAPPDDTSSLFQWKFGIRLGFRPDYKE